MRAPSLLRFEQAMESISERVKRATTALERHAVAYEVVGGVAVAAWVFSVDPDAVRSTLDVDIMIRRADLDTARRALEEEGFIFRHALGVSMFVDPVERRARGAIYLVSANERVRPEYEHPAPALSQEPPTSAEGFRIAPLSALVEMKLTSFRLKDQVRVKDLLDAGLITAEIESALPADLRDRLDQVRRTP